jgi:predicted AlkP superfamily phosphohydrolase/phosphomutase
MTRARLRSTRLLPILVAIATIMFAGSCRRGPSHDGPRVIILGFDGLDYGLTRDLIAQGKLPNFARLTALGTFAPLGSSLPPQSPVAWSTFITGLDPGAHGIFDFVHRDPHTMTPYLSTTRTEPPGHAITIGSYRFPLSSGRVELLRHGQPFWEPLEDRGIRTTIVRMPANFPPSGSATRELSGMGTPDILGTYGEFTLYSSAATASVTALNGGSIRRLARLDAPSKPGGVYGGTLDGGTQPYRVESEPLRVDFFVDVDTTRQFARFIVGDEIRLVKAGDWTDWVPVTFDVRPMQSLRAEVRLFVKSLSPDVEIYASPLNVDPLAPAVPISNPRGYAADLARATGRFYTQGMPEDTKSLKTGILSTGEFLQQARIALDENRRQFQHVLATDDSQVVFYYFGTVDLVSHMLWRSLDPQHPAYQAAIDAPNAPVIPSLYAELDAVAGEALMQLRPSDLLVVMSDHGFASWRRAFNLNTWLRDEGYLAPVGRGRADGPATFGDVDLTRSRAYGLGLNGLFLNLKGREAFGTVAPDARDALLSEITSKLAALVDPATGQRVVSHVYRREQVYSSAGHDDLAPDLVIGYAKGTRVSDDSALGVLAAQTLADNTSAWSGDHCMDPETVPGILLTNRPLRAPAPNLQSLAAAILTELGVQGFPRR